MIRHSTIPIYAQAEEDIIIAGLLERLEMPDDRGTFVEIGVGDGQQNNTRSLAARGWSGLWIGNVPIGIQPERVAFYFCQVELDNLLTLPLPRDGDPPVDLFSLDIDGNDYWIAEQLVPRLTPKILVVEYNKDAGADWIMPYAKGYQWKPGMPFGAALPAWQQLLEPMGYTLAAVTKAQVNAFFIRG